jgi:hypothetical protein
MIRKTYDGDFVHLVNSVPRKFPLTFLGGLVLGVAKGAPSLDPKRVEFADILATFLFGTVGFTISACLAPYDRWRHLKYVALAVWIANIYVLFFGFGITRWIGSIIFFGIMAGLGGAFSYLFKRDN